MKLLNLSKKRTSRVNTEDALGQGMDATILMAMFLLIGYGLDRLLGTLPVFMIVSSVLGAVGIFAKFKYRYDAKMDAHEATRLGAADRRRAVAMRERTAEGERSA